MAKSSIPAVLPADGDVGANNLSTRYHNLVPFKGADDKYYFTPRPFYSDTDIFRPTADHNYGRGMFSFDGDNIHRIVNDRFYHGASSYVDMTANSGISEEILASFCVANLSGNDALVVQNAGSTAFGTGDGNVYYVTSGLGTPVAITDSNMPGNNGEAMARGAVYLDGYLFVFQHDGAIHNSNLDDLSTWDALAFITAERALDQGSYLGKQKNHLIAFGTESIELFYNAGISGGSPLARRQDIYYEIGLAHPNAIVEYDDIIYFVGLSAQTKKRNLYKIENLQLSLINNPYIDKQLQNTGNDWRIFLSILSNSIFGTTTLLINIHSYTYAMDLATGVTTWWYCDSDPTYTSTFTLDWTTSYPIINQNGDTGSNAYVQFANGVIGQELSSTSTTLRDLYNTNLATGLGTPQISWYSPPWDMQTGERKRISRADIHQYPDADSDLSSTSRNFSLSWRDTEKLDSDGLDDASFTTARTADARGYRAVFHRLGSTRQRIFKVDFDNESWQKFKMLELTYEQLRG